VRIAVLGTGIVGRTLAGGLSAAGHDVVIGTRDAAATLARTEPDGMGNPPFSQWHADHQHVKLVTFAEAAGASEVIVNATSGGASLASLESAGAANLAGKPLLDVANPLDFSQGMPPTLLVANTDSLAEQIQRAHPDAKVVKTLNTMSAVVMVDPGRLPESHDVFVAGDDASAKDVTRELLRGVGWKDDNIVDVGGVRSARGLEMYLPLWLSVFGSSGSADFNIKIVRA
jgi:predicted dinucleotide-binding enzyme